MSALLQFVGNGGHALAAALFAALGIYALRRGHGTPERTLLSAALLLTACWALYIAFGGVEKPLSGLMESVRNVAWLLLMFVMLRRGEGARSGRLWAISAVYAVLAGLIATQCFIDVIWRQLDPLGDLHRSLVTVSLTLRMMTAIGALVLVHNLFSVSAPEGRSRIALLMGALAAMWTYDLNLYVIGYLAIERANELYALRGLVVAMLAPVLAIGLHKDVAGRLRLSRTVTFRSLSVVAVGLYVILLAAATALIELVAGPFARLIEIGGLFVMAVAGLLLLPSRRLRALAKVQVAKHFFQHRYDYRAEWMRFGDTIGQPGDDAAPLGVRVVKAVADITESPAGMLLLRDDTGALSLETQWNWVGDLPPSPSMSDKDAQILEDSGWIADLDGLAAGRGRITPPGWMVADRRIWALVPLIHFGRLTGVILLARPAVDRRLDWEDFDMLRAAGRQAASYISEAQGQQALDDAQRFEEFNRRFAFIMHDVKNLVSQISLVARNAERHADNPAFRADMVLTLKDSVGKMNELLARLSQHHRVRPADPVPMSLRDVAAVVIARARQHRVTLSGDAPLVLADPARVEQILTHLIQNAIDASAGGHPVEVRLGREGRQALVDIIDQGCGMSAEYIRRELFKPFSSSKAGGFGIGAFEARSLALALGGGIDVESRPDAGSRFTLRLPLAAADLDAKSTEVKAA
ncbi:XrtA/PEP-CTERM system histidine kinase PrsK [Sphingobium sp. AN641]|uniref:XrtA/PEP-CTERM system histidine kinase PrsK n=1 Tax=Sphingobium sp. AN641 TaxID=3133443 RepID=UPI0030BCF8CE